jgi:hypothetical protein
MSGILLSQLTKDIPASPLISVKEARHTSRTKASDYQEVALP